jgi:CBS domain-containing protein
MAFSGSENILDIDRAIDYSPSIVNVNKDLNEAIDLISQAKGSYCDFACTEKNLNELPKHNQPSSCLVVTDNNVLAGILTERDLVKLAVKNVSLKN